MQDLTHGSIPKHLVRLSSFLAVSMLLQTLYFLVDLYFVSNIGGAAIAGVGLAGNLMMIVLALTQMVGVGTTSLIAQAAGRKDQADAQSVFDQSCQLSIVIGLAMLAVGMLLRVPYCRWLSADQATSEAAAGYLLWLIPSFALQFGFVAMGSALRATGIVKPGMIVQALTVGLNAILAPVLIAGWGTGKPLGTVGAGLATFIAICAGVVALATFFVGMERFVKIDISAWTKPRFDVWKRMLAIGLPAGGEFVMMSVYTAFVYWLIRHKGSDAQAGFGVGVRLMQSLFLPVMAISFGASPLAGQNFGARKPDRVRQTFRVAAIMAAAVMAIMTVFCHVSPESLVRVFAHEAPVIANGTEYLRILSWGFIAYGVNATSSSMFQAIGNTWPSLAASVIRVSMFAVGALWLARDPAFALGDVWVVAVVVGFFQCALSLTLLQREFGKKLGPA
ncbi:MAG: MATE family efflux transporter [Bryobacteraceae bacterium]